MSLFVADTRLLSSPELSVDGRELSIASTRAATSDRTIVLLPITGRNQTSDVVLTLEQRMVSNGLHQSVRVQSTSRLVLTVTLRLEVGTDFADQFALRSDTQVFDRSAAIRIGRPSGYGFTASALRVAEGIAAAAAHFDQRLPELFGGFARADFEQPVSYAHAARPQAWAAAAGATAARILRLQPR